MLVASDVCPQVHMNKMNTVPSKCWLLRNDIATLIQLQIGFNDYQAVVLEKQKINVN